MHVFLFEHLKNRLFKLLGQEPGVKVVLKLPLLYQQLFSVSKHSSAITQFQKYLLIPVCIIVK